MGWQIPWSNFQKERRRRRLEREKRDRATGREATQESCVSRPARARPPRSPFCPPRPWVSTPSIWTEISHLRTVVQTQLHFKDKYVKGSHSLTVFCDLSRSAHRTQSNSMMGTKSSIASAIVAVIKGGWQCHDLNWFGLSFSYLDHFQLVICIFNLYRERERCEQENKKLCIKFLKNMNFYFSIWVCVSCFPYRQEYTADWSFTWWQKWKRWGWPWKSFFR